MEKEETDESILESTIETAHTYRLIAKNAEGFIAMNKLFA